MAQSSLALYTYCEEFSLSTFFKFFVKICQFNPSIKSSKRSEAVFLVVYAPSMNDL
jgi:hypothetical protein